MPYINIANSTTVFTTTGLRLNIVTVSGPQGPRGTDGTGVAGIRVTGSSLLPAPNLIGTGSVSVFLDGNTIYFSGVDTSFSGVSGLLNQKIDTLSGFLYGTIVATGNAAINYTNSVGTIISGNLTQSGITLMGLINVASGGVKSINGVSGALTLTGAGNISVTNAGNIFTISGNTGTYANFATVANLQSTGQQAWTAANSNAINLSGNLTQTGITLNGKIDSISGWAGNSSGALNSIIIATGNAAITHSNGIGSILSGNITATGATLLNSIAQTGQQAWTAAQNNATNLSGSLTTTGSTLDSKINSLSGFATNVLSGGLQSQIAQTGAAAISYSNSVASIISGNLTASGQLLSAVKVTGSSVINIADFTGIGGAIVFYSGNKIFISGGATSAGGSSTTGMTTGVTSLNSLVGSVSITGTGGLTVLVNGSVISISGDNSISGALTQTGISLGSKIDSVSGWALNVVSGGLETRITQSGSAAISYANGIGTNLSGNLTQTGISLINRDLLVSGWLTTGLANTGQAAWTAADNNARNLSGNLTSTGSTLDSKINSLSGFVGNVSGGLETRIFQTGAAAITYSNSIGTSISGSIATTGQQAINYSNSIGANVSGTIALTGQTAWTHSQNNALNLSGNLQLTGSNLQTQINNITNGTGNVLSNVVFTTGNQYIVGTKYFIGNTYIDNLFVTGSQTVINTQDLYVGDNWITLNATGGARDSAIFVSTGFTGASSTGGVLGFDVPSNTWRFGIASQQTDLINLPRIASGEATDLLDSKVNSLSGFTSNLSGAVDNRIIATGNAAVSHSNGIGTIISGNLTQTGITLFNQHNSIGQTLSGVIATTGSNLYILITGLSGQANTNYATVINLAATGSTLDSKINSLSGFVGGSSNKVTSLNNLTGALSLVGVAGIQISTGIGTITISGSNTSSEQFFITGVPSGVDNYYINFPRNFAQTPIIVPSIQTSGQTIYSLDISETSLSGFRVLFSNDVLESGVFLNVYALESGGISLGGSNGTSITVTGSNSLTSVDFTGIGGTLVYTQQNKIYISGGASSAVTAPEFHPFFFLGT